MCAPGVSAVQDWAGSMESGPLMRLCPRAPRVVCFGQPEILPGLRLPEHTPEGKEQNYQQEPPRFTSTRHSILLVLSSPAKVFR
ncbi:MAG: hypothetical protein IH820_10125 [Bacteroidetes bacterium]|nr:hypothetical protein [Bacteroidota bacterium]